MPVYNWVAETKKGKVIKGELEAADEKSAGLQLRRRNLKIKKIKPKPKDVFENVSFMQPKVTKKDIVIFTRQFSTMIDAGLPLVQGLTILAEQMENKTFKRILKEVVKDVEGGSSLAEAMEKHPDVFDSLFINLVAAGEVGGILDTILQRLAAYIEKVEKLKSQIKGAMTYPMVVVAIAIIVIAVIMIFSRTLGTMISSGVPIITALEIVAKTSGNVVLEEVILDVRSSIAEGQPIAEPLSENDIFPNMVVQMIAVGEATGALDAMLEKIADFYDDEVDVAVEAMTSMLEPLLMVFLGGAIGGLVIAMYLPIFGMAAAMGS